MNYDYKYGNNYYKYDGKFLQSLPIDDTPYRKNKQPYNNTTRLEGVTSEYITGCAESAPGMKNNIP